jgi:hypothetical protein
LVVSRFQKRSHLKKFRNWRASNLLRTFLELLNNFFH